MARELKAYVFPVKTSYHSIKSVEPINSCIAGNAKKLLNWSSLQRNFLATARTKNSRLVPKLFLRHILSGNIQLVAFWGVTTNHGTKFFDLSLIRFGRMIARFKSLDMSNNSTF
jgi:hypothetical protein